MWPSLARWIISNTTRETETWEMSVIPPREPSLIASLIGSFVNTVLSHGSFPPQSLQMPSVMLFDRRSCRLHLLVLFLNSQELLSIFHSVCSFPHKRGRVLPPKSVSLPTNLIWTEIGWRSFKEGRRECLPACHPALKRVG